MLRFNVIWWSFCLVWASPCLLKAEPLAPRPQQEAPPKPGQAVDSALQMVVLMECIELSKQLEQKAKLQEVDLEQNVEIIEQALLKLKKAREAMVPFALRFPPAQQLLPSHRHHLLSALEQESDHHQEVLRAPLGAFIYEHFFNRSEKPLERAEAIVAAIAIGGKTPSFEQVVAGKIKRMGKLLESMDSIAKLRSEGEGEKADALAQSTAEEVMKPLSASAMGWVQIVMRKKQQNLKRENQRLGKLLEIVESAEGENLSQAQRLELHTTLSHLMVGNKMKEVHMLKGVVGDEK